MSQDPNPPYWIIYGYDNPHLNFVRSIVACETIESLLFEVSTSPYDHIQICYITRGEK